MRAASPVVAIALVLSAASLAAQTPDSVPRDRVTLDVGGGVSRHAPHVLGGLEVAMTRWLAIRGEGLFSASQRNVPAGYPLDYRYASMSVSGVISYKSDTRISPYVFGGLGLAASQGFGISPVPIVGGGLRFRFGRLQPFVELRAHRSLGTPISLGLRF